MRSDLLSSAFTHDVPVRTLVGGAALPATVMLSLGWNNALEGCLLGAWQHASSLRTRAACVVCCSALRAGACCACLCALLSRSTRAPAPNCLPCAARTSRAPHNHTAADDQAYVVKVYPLAVATALAQLARTAHGGLGLPGVWWGLAGYYFVLLVGFAGRFFVFRSKI